MKQLYLGLIMLFASSLFAQTNNIELIGNTDFSNASLFTDGTTAFATGGTTGQWYAGGTDIPGYNTTGFQNSITSGSFDAIIPTDASAVFNNFVGQVTTQSLNTGRYRISVAAKGTAPIYLKISSTNAMGTELTFILRNASSAAIEKQSTPDYSGYSLKITPTADWATYTADLDLTNGTTSTVRMYFVFPKAGTVSVDDISLKRTKDIPTTYYIRPTDNTTAWTATTGVDADQIITTTALALSGTNTYYFAAGNYTTAALTTITTGKLYGGFSGNETTIDLNSRATSDKDGNGLVEPWELTNEVSITSTGANSSYAGTGYSARLLAVTGGEVNGITFSDYHYNQASGNGAIILGAITSTPIDLQNIPANAGALKYCIIRKFKTTIGSGTVMMTNSASVIDKCLIEDCRSLTDGGAIFMSRMGGLVSNSVLRNNIAVGGHGGAIYAGPNAVATNYTGGLHANYAAVVSNCAIYNNTGGTLTNKGGGAIRGEAVSILAKGLEVINCTVVNNTTGVEATDSSIELINSGVIANSIVVSDSNKEIRPNTTTNYVVSTVYGVNGGLALYPTTAANNVSGIADDTFTAINFKTPTTFKGAIGNSSSEVGTYTEALKNEIKAANFSINNSSSNAVTTASAATLPATYANSGNVSPTGTVTIKATVPTSDMLSVTRTGNFTLGAYQLGGTVTWNGSVWSNNNIGPNSTIEAIIDGTYNGAAFDAKKLTINSDKSLTVTSGNMTVQNEVINNGSTVIENNANLIQVNNTTNTGNIVVNRNSSPLLRLDYTLWSSPVAGQNLAAFSLLTSQNTSRFYTYDTANNQYSNAFDPTVTNFATGTGYLIRMPNTADAVTPTAYAGQFTGVPNNGDISFTLSTAGNGYNLVGNPYPSPIIMTQFVADNTANITGTLYFWRKTNGVGTAYCTWAGGIFATNGNAQSVDPNNIIQTGQGFFVKATAVGSVSFKNGQRVANTTGQFFKTKQVATSDRIWLNATNTAGDFSQMALNYTTGATQGVDFYDGKYINDSPLALTSNINNEEYTIQGRPAFDASDVVPLNFKTAVPGDYTIAIDHSEGVFAAGQSVILTDATTGTETDLTTSSYTFTAVTGTENSRFSLKYQKTLGANKAVFNDNNVSVYKSKGTLYVNAGDSTIANIKVYDVQGRLVAELKNMKATSATIANLKATSQVLIVKITSHDNKIVTKKVVN